MVIGDWRFGDTVFRVVKTASLKYKHLTKVSFTLEKFSRVKNRYIYSRNKNEGKIYLRCLNTNYELSSRKTIQ